MADRRVKVVVEAEVAGYRKGMQEASKATTELGKAAETASKQTESMGGGKGSGLQKFSASLKENRADIEQVGGALTAMGATLTAVAGLSAKAAIDWESAWTGVLKTNDGTSEQIAQLEGDLRGLAKTLPATHSEIAAVAEAAGQLGVGIDDVSEFTKTMIDLGESTNLSAEEAATSLARFSNITGTAFSDVDKLGSAIVGLGNNFATTESEIMMMSMRVAAVGTQVGLTEGEILGLATAMSSVGVEAEAGGTAISMVMKKIDASVREGGESLTGWAEAAGVSAQEFAAAWQSEPSKAMEMLVTGLGSAATAGQDVNGMLSDLGVKGVRESDTLLRLASAGELLGEAFRTGNEEFSKGSALAAEATKRYETTESKVRIAWNNIKDAAIDAGAVMLPAISTLADGAVAIAQAFGNLPAPVQGGVTAIAGISGAALLAAGGMMRLLPAAADTVEAARNLSAQFPRATSAMGKFAKGAGIAAAGLVGLEILKGIANDATPAAAGLEAVANAILAVGEAKDIAALDDLFNINSDVRSFGDALKMLDPSDLNSHMENFGETLGFTGTSSARARAQMVELDQVLSTMDPSTAAERMSDLREEAERTGSAQLSSWSELKKLFPEYAASVEQAANATGKATSEADLFQAAMGNLPPHMRAAGEAAKGAGDGAEAGAAGIEAMAAASEELAEQLDEALDNLRAMGAIPRDAAAAARDYEAALDDMAASIKENGTSLDITTEKGRANQAALADLAQATLDHAAAAHEAGASTGDLANIMAGGAQSVYDFALQLTGSKTEADALTRSIFDIPDNVDIETYMSTDALAEVEALSQAVQATPEKIEILSSMDDTAKAKAFETAEAIKAIPGYKRVDVAVDDQGTPGQIQSRINALTGKTEYVFVTDDGTVAVTQQKITGIDGKTEYVYVTDDGTVVATQGSINNIQGKSVPVVAEAKTAAAEADLNHAARPRYVSIVASVTGNTSPKLSPYIARPGGYTGGVVGQDFGLPRFAGGGRLPYYGLGTDAIVGIGSHGAPTALVDDGEWVIRERSSRKFDRLLGLINADHASVQHLAGYAAGGRVGREWSASSAVAPKVTVEGHTMTAPTIDYSRLAQAMSGLRVVMDSRAVGTIIDTRRRT